MKLFIPLGESFSNGNTVYGPCKDDTEVLETVNRLWPGGRKVIVYDGYVLDTAPMEQKAPPISLERPHNGSSVSSKIRSAVFADVR